jgi:hypothetical protein
LQGIVSRMCTRICDKKEGMETCLTGLWKQCSTSAGMGAPSGLCKAAYDARALASCMVQSRTLLVLPQRDDSHR